MTTSATLGDDDASTLPLPEISNICSQLTYGEDLKHVNVYLQCPEIPNQAVLSRGTIVPFASNVLRELCEKYSLRRGHRTMWICKRKDQGRLRATCSFAGSLQRTKGKGKRGRRSKKVGCSAIVSTLPLHAHPDFSLILPILKNFLTNRTMVIGNEGFWCTSY